MDIKLEILENGLTLSWIGIPNTNKVSLIAFVRSGPIYEHASQSGISHLLEHLHLSFTERHEKREKLARELDDILADVEAITALDCTQIAVNVANGEAARAASLLANILSSSKFPPDGIEAEKQLLVSEMVRSDGATITSILHRHLFGDHAATLSAYGTANSIFQLSIDEINDANRRFYQPRNMVVAIAGILGDTLRDDVLSCLSRNWSFPSRALA